MAIDREALLASLPPEYLTPANLGYWSSLDDQSLQTSVSSIKRNLGKSFDDLMALGEKQTDWQKAAADYAKQNIYGNYAVDDPLAYYNAFGTIPINSLGKSYYGIDEKTWQTDTKEGAEGIKYLEPTAGATYKLYSPKYGTVYGTASTPAELANLAKIAQDQTLAQGRSADWELVQTTPGAEDQVVASNYWNPDVTTFGKIFGSLLPIATAFIPGLNLLGTIATQTASGAAGAAMAGRNPLTGALIGGATAGLMGAPILKGGQSISGALGQAVGAGGKGALEAAAGALPGEIVVTAAPKLLESAINAGVAGLTQQIGSALPSLTQSQQPTLEQQFDETFGTGTPQAPTATGGGLSALEPPITVVGTPSSALNIAPGIPGIGAGALTSAINATQPTGTSGSDRLEQTQEQPVESKDDIVVKAYNEGLTVDQIAAMANLSVGAVNSIIQQATISGTSPITAGAGRPEPTTTTTAGAVTGGLTAAANAAANAPEYVDTTPIEVVAEPKPLDLTGPAPVVTIPPGALTEIGNTIPNLPEPQTETPPAEEIVVKGKPETQPTPTPVIPPATTTTTTQTTDTPKADAKTDTTTETPKKPLTLEQILGILGLGTGLIGDLLSGGGGGGALGTIPAGLFTSGTGTSIFNKPLPAPNLPGLGPGGTGIGARSPSDFTATTGLPTPGSGASNIDWYRYGYGPEQSFFKQVPQGAKNASQAFTGYEVPFRGLQNMAEGGYAVGGPGDGRDDKIPAMLSDGEYVMDAETVAMLGNGSSKAGAKALDRFRVNIRKHKGRSMARGNFSVKAKKPEKYLQKDRA